MSYFSIFLFVYDQNINLMDASNYHNPFTALITTISLELVGVQTL